MTWNAPTPSRKVLRLHAENASFLVRHLELAREGPNERLVDLYDFEARLDGNLRALALAGDIGLDVALEVLAEGRGFGELAVCMNLALQRRSDMTFSLLLPEVELSPAEADALGAGIGLVPPLAVGDRLRLWLGGADPRATLAALDTCSRLRVDPRSHLAPLLGHHEPQVVARAARLAGELGRADLSADLVRLLERSPSPLVRFEAARAATLLGDRMIAPARLQELPAEAPPWMWRAAAELLPLVLPAERARAVIAAWFSQPGTQRWAVVATGALGAPDTLGWLLRQMTKPLLSRSAGIAFALIMGVRLGPENLELDEFPEDPDDPSIETCPVEAFIDSHAYWPDPAKIEAWLGGRQARVSSSDRSLLGAAAWTHAVPPEPGEFPQIAQRALAHEIALRSPTAPLPNWRAKVLAHDRGFTRRW